MYVKAAKFVVGEDDESRLKNGISYTYDELGRVVEVLPASYSQVLNDYTEITNAENVSYTYDAEGYLSSIVTDSTTYTLTYDAFGNSSGVAAGDNTLAQYEYNANNGKLKKITYGNGYAERYVYDELERLSEVWYNINGVETLAASYEYTRDGALYRVTDHRSGRVTEIKYDTRGRAVGYVEYSEDEGERYAEGYVTYDDESRVTKDVIYLLYNVGTEAAPEWNKVSSTLTYTYDDEGKLTASGRGGIYVSYTYDELGRIIGISNSISGSVCNETEYVYKDGTSGLIEKYVSTVGSGESAVANEYTVEYNSRGYISRIIYPDGKNIFYTYDDLGQLVREANEVLGKTYEYEYDNAGNLIGKNNRNYSSWIINSQENYGYYDTEWGDRLTDYNEADLVNLYDEIGNPTRWRGGEFTNMTWEGRRLVSALKGNVQYAFTYNDEGIRTSKTVNGVEHKYTLNGTQILSEQWGNNLLVFIYDTTGAPIGMRYLNTADSTAVWETYWFEKNLFGDIVAVYNSSGTKLVSYLYDAWGNQTVTTHVTGTAAQYNPFRYRGYYYDADFGLYYLQSRYYDSMSYRFINADIFVSTGQGLTGSNMFAYCGNNPVNFVDPTGEFFLTFLICVGVGVAVGATIGGVYAYNAAKESGAEGEELAWKTFEGILKGALIGGIAGAFVGATAGAIATYGIGSTISTAMLSNTITTTARAFEVGALQMRKSLNDGDSWWQAGADCVDSLLINGVSIVKSTGIKAGTTLGSYIIKNIFHKLEYVRPTKYMEQPGNGMLAYFLAGMYVIETIYSALSPDPELRAIQRGYVLK